jgi:hypothetical protein
MKRPMSLFLSLLGVFAVPAVSQVSPQGSPQGSSQGTASERPRLVVLCSVDQLASWVFQQAEPYFAADGGFRRLQREGVYFPQCAYQHGCTETGPGHATIGTGAPASVHGIVRNNWYSPATKRLQYCVQETMAGLPELPEGKDRGPGLLLVPTLGDGLKAHIPGSKVASVSWKDRAAILMAGGSADSVVWFENATGNLVTNTRWVKAVPAWVTQFNTTRAIDAFHGWQWGRFAGPDAYAGLQDDRPYEAPHANGSKSRTLPQLVTGGTDKPGKEYYAEVYTSPIANTMVRLAAEACVDALELGSDPVPDLMCVSFSANDLVGHYFGPDSVEARDTLLRLDRELAQWLTFLDGKVGKGNYAFFLTADHGVGPVPEAAKAAGVDAGRGPLQMRARAAAEKALSDRYGAPGEGKRYVTHVGEFSLFLDQDVLAAQRGSRDAEAFLLEASRVAAAGAQGAQAISAAFATADLFDKGNSPDPVQRALALGLCRDRAGDVQFVIKPYWLDGATPASHGTPHSYDREVVGFAMGCGAPRGARSAQAITPGFGVVWFAHLLGIPRPTGAVDLLPAEMLTGR